VCYQEESTMWFLKIVNMAFLARTPQPTKAVVNYHRSSKNYQISIGTSHQVPKTSPEIVSNSPQQIENEPTHSAGCARGSREEDRDFVDPPSPIPFQGFVEGCWCQCSPGPLLQKSSVRALQPPPEHSQREFPPSRWVRPHDFLLSFLPRISYLF
jgi:hypothetical protein